MSNHYICGTVLVKAINSSSDDTMSIMVKPAEGFLAPNKKNAIMFPEKAKGAKSACLVKLKQDNKYHEFKMLNTDRLLSVFIQAAATQKKIKIIIQNAETTPEIVGCVFPENDKQ